MKQLKTSSEYLLPGSLKDLHEESRNWEETIAFWKDETRFFGTLLDTVMSKIGNESEFTLMLQNLDHLHSDLYDYLAEDIRAHERVLSNLEKGQPGIADEDYRHKHRILKEKMQVFTKDFREFKKMVFGYARKF